MGASSFMKYTATKDGIKTGSIDRYTCCCHPRSWGLKKGLRRTRRRFSKKIILEELATEP